MTTALDLEAVMARRPQSVYACDFVTRWLWVHGWVNKRKFKGACLSHGFDGESDSPDEDRRDIIKAKVIHGWIISVAGDASGCGWDVTSWLLDTEPSVVDGRWDGATTYDEDGNEAEGGAEVVDGPHKATWMELA